MTAPVRREPVGSCQRPGDAAQAVQQGEQVAATVGGAGGSAHRGIAMQQAYRRYCKAAAVAFMLVTLYTVPTKLLEGRLGHDWGGGCCIWVRRAGCLRRLVGPSAAPARAVTWAVGVGYFALGATACSCQGCCWARRWRSRSASPRTCFTCCLASRAWGGSCCSARRAG